MSLETEAKLMRELNATTDSLLRSQTWVIELTAERDALAAHCEALRNALGMAIGAFDSVWLRFVQGNGPDINEVAVAESLERAREIKRGTPIPSLAEHDRRVREPLLAALEDARMTIRLWHGMGMKPEAATRAWEIYWSKAPALACLRAALTEEP